MLSFVYWFISFSLLLKLLFRNYLFSNVVLFFNFNNFPSCFSWFSMHKSHWIAVLIIIILIIIILMMMIIMENASNCNCVETSLKIYRRNLFSIALFAVSAVYQFFMSHCRVMDSNELLIESYGGNSLVRNRFEWVSPS